ncbi:MAG: hypothetical protein K2N55_00255 [Lachnospiraceae bacterium]|nr:hypothetical protein [Lachnospiraceae bacterium]
MKKKILLVLGVAGLILMILLAWWNKRPTYEGGNIALQYNRGKWHLTYRKEASLVFCLESRKNSDYILIVPIEDDGSIFERFHEDFLVELTYPYGFVVEKESKIDVREEQGYLYYNDSVHDRRGDKADYITFGKKLEDIYVIGQAYINISEEDAEKNVQTRQNEALEILSSITYSEQKNMWMLQDKEYEWFIDYWVWSAKQNEGKWEEPDKTKDSVPDEETAKRIAEEYDKESGWYERKNQDLDYEVNVIYLEQSYIWVLIYSPKAPEGHAVIDGGGGTVRIRRDSGEVTDDTRGRF